jgi:hypothetical protein
LGPSAASSRKKQSNATHNGKHRPERKPQHKPQPTADLFKAQATKDANINTHLLQATAYLP